MRGHEKTAWKELEVGGKQRERGGRRGLRMEERLGRMVLEGNSSREKKDVHGVGEAGRLREI